MRLARRSSARSIRSGAREAADAGQPVFERAPKSEAALAIAALAERLQAARQGQIRKQLTVLS